MDVGVDVENIACTDNLLHIRPNPVQNKLMVRSVDQSHGNAHLIIHNALGRHAMAMLRMMVLGVKTGSMDNGGLANDIYRITLAQGDNRMHMASERE